MLFFIFSIVFLIRSYRALQIGNVRGSSRIIERGNKTVVVSLNKNNFTIVHFIDAILIHSVSVLHFYWKFGTNVSRVGQGIILPFVVIDVSPEKR